MKALALAFSPLTPVGGAEVSGIDFRAELPEEIKAQLRDAWRRYALLLFRDQELTPDDQRRAAEIFGPINKHAYSKYAFKDEGIDFVSNVVEEGHNPYGDLGFHTENSMYPTPLSAVMLYCLEAPPEGAGGETLFANLALAYESLPETLRRRIVGLKVRHGYPDPTKGTAFPGLVKDADAPKWEQPLEYRHPVTGKNLLFLSRRHVDVVVGLPEAESRALIEELSGYITDPKNTFGHPWRPRDLVVWDNLTLQHGRADFDRKYRRHMRRLQID